MGFGWVGFLTLGAVCRTGLMLWQSCLFENLGMAPLLHLPPHSQKTLLATGTGC